jgi:hypothetical protein
MYVQSAIYIVHKPCQPPLFVCVCVCVRVRDKADCLQDLNI